MQVLKYNKKLHEAQLKQLLNARGLEESNLLKVPKNGIVCLQDGKLVAAGFLRLIENNMGMLDSYITNPEFSSELRNKALDFITNSLICQAKHLQIQELMAISAHDSIISRSLTHDFKSVDFKFSIRKLT